VVKNKKRKSPVRHTVRPYNRGNSVVSSYLRGKGLKSSPSSRRRVVGETSEPPKSKEPGFVVNFKYSDKKDDGESVLVLVNPNLPAKERYEKAMDEAFEERVDNRFPAEMQFIDPSLGEMLEWTSKRVRGVIKFGTPVLKKAARLGAKYAVKATMIAGETAKKVAKGGLSVTKEMLRLAAFKAHEKHIQRLLKDCYHKNALIRTSARSALKRWYAEIYDMCDFSREKGITWRKRTPRVSRLPRRVVRM